MTLDRGARAADVLAVDVHLGIAVGARYCARHGVYAQRNPLHALLAQVSPLRRRATNGFKSGGRADRRARRLQRRAAKRARMARRVSRRCCAERIAAPAFTATFTTDDRDVAEIRRASRVARARGCRAVAHRRMTSARCTCLTLGSHDS